MGPAVQGSSRRPDKIIVFINKPLRSYSGQLHTHTQASGHAIAQCDLEQNQSENKKTTKWQRWSFGRRLGWGKSKRGNRDVCDENVSNTCMRLTNDKLKKSANNQIPQTRKKLDWISQIPFFSFVSFTQLHLASESLFLQLGTERKHEMTNSDWGLSVTKYCWSASSTQAQSTIPRSHPGATLLLKIADTWDVGVQLPLYRTMLGEFS